MLFGNCLDDILKRETTSVFSRQARTIGSEGEGLAKRLHTYIPSALLRPWKNNDLQPCYLSCQCAARGVYGWPDTAQIGRRVSSFPHGMSHMSSFTQAPAPERTHAPAHTSALMNFVNVDIMLINRSIIFWLLFEKVRVQRERVYLWFLETLSLIQCIGIVSCYYLILVVIVSC